MKWTTEDDQYLRKMRGAGSTVGRIAVRMGRSIEDVQDRIDVLEKEVLSKASNGLGELVQAFTLLCFHYEQLGEQLKKLSIALSSATSLAELEEQGLDTKTATDLRSKFIILKPYLPEEETLDKE